MCLSKSTGSRGPAYKTIFGCSETHRQHTLQHFYRLAEAHVFPAQPAKQPVETPEWRDFSKVHRSAHPLQRTLGHPWLRLFLQNFGLMLSQDDVSRKVGFRLARSYQRQRSASARRASGKLSGNEGNAENNLILREHVPKCCIGDRTLVLICDLC